MGPIGQDPYASAIGGGQSDPFNYVPQDAPPPGDPSTDPTNPAYYAALGGEPPWIKAGYPDFASWSAEIGGQKAADEAYRQAQIAALNKQTNATASGNGVGYLNAQITQARDAATQAHNAALLALQQGNSDEARRQFDISSQELARSHQMDEQLRQQNQDLNVSKFANDVYNKNAELASDPRNFMEQFFRLRGQTPPASASQYGNTPNNGLGIVPFDQFLQKFLRDTGLSGQRAQGGAPQGGAQGGAPADPYAAALSGVRTGAPAGAGTITDTPGGPSYAFKTQGGSLSGPGPMGVIPKSATIATSGLPGQTQPISLSDWSVSHMGAQAPSTGVPNAASSSGPTGSVVGSTDTPGLYAGASGFNPNGTLRLAANDPDAAGLMAKYPGKYTQGVPQFARGGKLKMTVPHAMVNLMSGKVAAIAGEERGKGPHGYVPETASFNGKALIKDPTSPSTDTDTPLPPTTTSTPNDPSNPYSGTYNPYDTQTTQDYGPQVPSGYGAVQSTMPDYSANNQAPAGFHWVGNTLTPDAPTPYTPPNPIAPDTFIQQNYVPPTSPLPPIQTYPQPITPQAPAIDQAQLKAAQDAAAAADAAQAAARAKSLLPPLPPIQTATLPNNQGPTVGDVGADGATWNGATWVQPQRAPAPPAPPGPSTAPAPINPGGSNAWGGPINQPSAPTKFSPTPWGGFQNTPSGLGKNPQFLPETADPIAQSMIQQGTFPPFLQRIFAQQQGLAGLGTNVPQQTDLPPGVPLVSQLALSQMNPSERSAFESYLSAHGITMEDYLAMVKDASPQGGTGNQNPAIPQFLRQ